MFNVPIAESVTEPSPLCKTCRWFMPNKPEPGLTPSGLCFRYPPKPVFDGKDIDSSYPETYEFNFCGEYKTA